MSVARKLDEAALKQVVADVLSQLNQGKSAVAPTAPAPPKPASQAPKPAPSRSCGSARTGGQDGAFSCAREASEAAHKAYLHLTEGGMAARRKVVNIVKTLCKSHAREWGKKELDETKIGRYDHKIEKLEILESIPGVEWIHPLGMSGDHGISMEEQAPFGVIGAITPSTHSVPTLACNIINMVAAGNTVVINPHPSAAKCAVEAVKVFNRAFTRETGIRNIATIVEAPTLESFAAIAGSEAVKLLCITGGPAVVKAALKSGKRAICAGPGNPPVVVDETVDLNRVARDIIQGAAYDNNLLCIGEKEVFVLDSVADALLQAFDAAGATRLNESQVAALTDAAFNLEPGEGAGCGKASVKGALIGKDPKILAQHAGATLKSGSQLLFGETGADHPFVMEEQMMPFVPIVRVPSFEEAVDRARVAERGYQHSAMIHSMRVDRMTHMARELKPTLFVKNGPCVAGLGNGGEGYPSYSIATTTGEGITTPSTFTRVRRCVMVDNLKIY
jgi:aldehyde dehydrogenase